MIRTGCKPDKLIASDINEPAYTRRMPGTVIYARPGDRLRIHVKNADIVPHSFHIHGVIYGIDSDGAWPFGTQSTDGRRSDEICPGQTWTYTYDVTDETIGAFPFHDHCHDIGTYISRGLFGGLVVLPEREHQTAAEWLAAWAKLVRGCKAAKALDKLRTARDTNQAHIDAVVAADPETAATLIAQLDRAL